MKRRPVQLVGIVSTVIFGLSTPGGMAFATAGTGVSGTVPVPGPTAGVVRGVAEEKIRTRGPVPYEVVVQTITIQPGGHTGWHTHPGIAVAVVKSGSLSIYDADDKSCTEQEYVAGQAYVDPGYGHAHIGRNEGDTVTEVLVTYLDVPIGGAVRIDAADPNNPNCPTF